MREIEYTPILTNGFKDITESDLQKEFVKPFDNGHEHRNKLLINFGHFLDQFKKLGIQAEVWIDGSFATYAPDPSDVDVVFYFETEQIDLLEEEKKQLFNKLFTSRDFMRNLYKVEVHYGEKDNEMDYQQWIKTFGTYYDNITPKGIFRMMYN
jgi:hypothetical protein